MAADEYLTVEEVAQKLKMHPGTIRRMLSKGELPGKRLGKEWRISAAELQKFMVGDSGRRQGSTEG